MDSCAAFAFTRAIGVIWKFNTPISSILIVRNELLALTKKQIPISRLCFPQQDNIMPSETVFLNNWMSLRLIICDAVYKSAHVIPCMATGGEVI